jgi:segregation and condensation protein A
MSLVVSYRHGVSVPISPAVTAARATAADAVDADGASGAAGTPDADDVSGAVVAEVPDGVPVPADDSAGVADVAPGDGTGEPGTDEAGSSRFRVTLANFDGPFDLLLQLISKHKLDVTEVALHKVTDEFIAYIRAMGDDWDLDEVSEFLVVAATLLDLKAARLLPAAAVEDEEDLALLEARDLLFARLLQYKAFKEAAAFIASLEGTGGRRWPRSVTLEPQYAEVLPDLVFTIGPQRLAQLAVKAMTPKVPPTVGISHVHMERVSVPEHALVLRDLLIRARTGTFRSLCSDCRSTLEIVARFLALLELYRQGLVGFDQVEALGELTVRWTGPTDTVVDLDVDEYAGTRLTEPDRTAEPQQEPPPMPSGEVTGGDDVREDAT